MADTKKMTDDEIIKALEYCLNNDLEHRNCNYCTFNCNNGGCIDELLKAAIGLINRQKAEIKNMRGLIHAQSDIIKSYCELLNELEDALKLAKAEAIKERGNKGFGSSGK